ncbi:MAG: hypothetical protein K2H45_09455, partial [Acetatifactor sp.]|nr:hypothetical protein [Acetatifactor sp.]
MYKIQKTVEYLLGSIIGILAANYVLLRILSVVLPTALDFFIGAAPVLFVLLNLYPALPVRRSRSYRLGVCNRGCNLLIIFIVTTLINVPLTIVITCLWLPGLEELMPGTVIYWLLHCLTLLGAEIILFWNGMLRVYLSSQQLGIRLRVIGIICGFIPIANVIVLFWIIRTASQEVRFENQKLLTDQARCQQQLCATKYPLLMVHG